MDTTKKTISVELNPEWLRVSMDLWRNGLDMKIPVADDIKIHFIQNRKRLLENFVKTAGIWESLLREMQATDDAEALKHLRNEVQEFAGWAKSELAVLERLRNESSS
jgi:hypothetical protein